MSAGVVSGSACASAVASSVGVGSGGGASVLLLDAFPGAAAAYSNRSLKSDWDGGFYNGSPNASEWLDQSGNTRNLWDLGVSSQRPLIVAGGLQFDGDTDMLAVSFSLIQPFTLFLRFTAGTYDATETAGLNNIISGASGTNVIIRRKSAILAEVFAGSFLTSSLPIANDEEMLLTILFNGASSSIWKNGEIVAVGDAGAGNPDGLRLAAYTSGDWRGSQQTVKELVVYPSDITANRSEIESIIRR